MNMIKRTLKLLLTRVAVVAIWTWRKFPCSSSTETIQMISYVNHVKYEIRYEGEIKCWKNTHYQILNTHLAK
jgi:hypothetical protein